MDSKCAVIPYRLFGNNREFHVMNDDERNLFRHTATLESGAAFCATREGGLTRISPLTPKADAWLRDHVPDGSDTIRIDNDLIIEMRYFQALADAIIADGFSFERNALPS